MPVLLDAGVLIGKRNDLLHGQYLDLGFCRISMWWMRCVGLVWLFDEGADLFQMDIL